MTARARSVVFEKARPLGIGRLTASARSISHPEGMLLGSSRGLFHIPDPESKPRRVRRHPVGFLLAGETGAVCYEERGGHGRLAILDGNLDEVRVDADLARSISPRAYWKNGLIILHQGSFAYLDLQTGERRTLAEFAPTRSLSPFARVDGGFEFIAIHRGPHWPTFLHRLALPDDPDGDSVVLRLAKAEDPVFARHFIPLPGGDYLVIPQGRPVFEIYKVLAGEVSGLRIWSLTPVAGETHPVGALLIDNRLYAACNDSMLVFRLADELLERK
jgi:hypothetical protein